MFNIKIVMVGGFSDAGGIQVHIKSLCMELVCNKNVEIHIISIASETDTLNEDGITIHFIKKPSHSNVRYFASPFLIIKKLIEIDPDVIHVHGTYLPYSIVAIMLKRLKKWPIVLTMHGSMLHELNATSNFPKRQYKYLKLIPKFHYQKKAFKNADKIIVVSKPARNIVEKNITDGSKVILIPNGVDFNSYRQTSTNNSLNNSLFFIGRLVKVKGCDVLIKAIPLIKNIVPDIHLYIAGDGYQRIELEELTYKLNISENVSFLGYLSGNKKVDLYNSVDICVVPSRFELFGLSLLEAMACGKPVVASNIGGIPNIVRDGETGYLFESNNVKELADNIVKLIKDEDLRLKMGESGKKRAKQLFSWDGIAEKVFNLYVECLNEHRKKYS